jgi:peptidoglycan LD-endopeptidase CwlK
MDANAFSVSYVNEQQMGFRNRIIDAELDEEDALKHNPAFPCPEEIILCQKVIVVVYYSFDGMIHQGQIVVHEELVEDIEYVFKVMLAEKFPITSAIPIADAKFQWDDELSMQANNSSGFNYRTIARTDRLSNHAYGRAVDINPRLNPYIRGDYIQPNNALYDVTQPGTITKDGVIVACFKERGWVWGGDWVDRKDYQHFEKSF